MAKDFLSSPYRISFTTGGTQYFTAGMGDVRAVEATSNAALGFSGTFKKITCKMGPEGVSGDKDFQLTLRKNNGDTALTIQLLANGVTDIRTFEADVPFLATDLINVQEKLNSGTTGTVFFMVFIEFEFD